MKPVFKEHTTSVLVAPAGWDEATNGKCADLPITKAHGALISYWKPSLRDLVNLLLFRREVRISIYSQTVTPLSVDTLE